MYFEIDHMCPSDWDQVALIYQEGIETGNATFEQSIPSWDSWILNHPLEFAIVARIDDEVLGWAALSPASRRIVYNGVMEVSVYVSEKHRGKGVGLDLLKKLIELSKDQGVWTLQAGIFPENQSSIILHAKCGFKIVGIREKIGKINGVWRDVVLMERRKHEVELD